MRTRRPPARVARTFLLLLLPVLLPGCAVTPDAGASFASRSPRGSTEVEVFNGRFEDLTVYLQMEGALIRLGRVTGKTSRVLTIPRQHVLLAGWMTLVAAHPDRVSHASSAEFQLRAGERAKWTIELYSGPSPVVY